MAAVVLLALALGPLAACGGDEEAPETGGGEWKVDVANPGGG